MGEPESPPARGGAGRGGAAREGIWYVDRASGETRKELVFSEGLMKFLYGHRLGRLLAALLTRRWFSLLYGLWLDSSLSRPKIRPFIEELQIPMPEWDVPARAYRSFNEFFARRLAAGLRPIDPNPDVYASSCDARTLVFPKVPDALSVKGMEVDLAGILDDRALARTYQGGSAVVYRLCPSDYHRFHFPDSGVPGPARAVPGRYHSVSPFALEKGIPVFRENARAVTLFESDGFGLVALVEVGAIGVGGIVQTYLPGARVERGAEKGFFKFGASSVVHLLEPGRVVFDPDLVEASGKGLETLVRFGSRIGRKNEAAEGSRGRPA